MDTCCRSQQVGAIDPTVDSSTLAPPTLAGSISSQVQGIEKNAQIEIGSTPQPWFHDVSQ